MDLCGTVICHHQSSRIRWPQDGVTISGTVIENYSTTNSDSILWPPYAAALVVTNYSTAQIHFWHRFCALNHPWCTKLLIPWFLDILYLVPPSARFLDAKIRLRNRAEPGTIGGDWPRNRHFWRSQSSEINSAAKSARFSSIS